MYMRQFMVSRFSASASERTQKALAPSCKLGLLQIRGTNQFVLEVAPRICFVFLHSIYPSQYLFLHCLFIVCVPDLVGS